ncbi:hypothetical protein ACE38W_14510 [Chitinophaga sp. Hz27]|uniref:hypothetical protein n=1 Tax=Chitinophaga sp. Hz27 TaxID=3347169 RepID=UPI0035D753DD
MNGKISITLGGELRHLWFNNYSRGEVKNLYGIDPSEIGKAFFEKAQANPFRAFEDLLWMGFIGYYYGSRQEMPYSKQQIAEWVAEADNDELVRVWNLWTEWSGVRELLSANEKKSPS